MYSSCKATQIQKLQGKVTDSNRWTLLWSSKAKSSIKMDLVPRQMRAGYRGKRDPFAWMAGARDWTGR
eukprot:m.304487 g.304487  ORF g.304487 m.304487 type:complete len:68 (+) comp16339_c0_seq8:287-490(+)